MTPPLTTKKVAIVGSGPAALMAAEVLSQAGIAVTIFEKRSGIGRKLLIAGSSGLNITNSLPLEEFISHYSGPRNLWASTVGKFTPQDWIHFIEKDLGISTFEGTSGRYFVENMKAAELLKTWKARLQNQGVTFYLGHELTDFAQREKLPGVELTFAGRDKFEFDAACLALGGGSYEPDEKPLRWPKLLMSKGLKFNAFRPSNVGFEVAWSEKFLAEAEGLPVKGITLRSPRGLRQGEIVITRYGIEGTPVYFVGQTGTAWIDFKPDQSVEQLSTRLRAFKENLSPLRRIKKQLHLDPASLAILFHHDSTGLFNSPLQTTQTSPDWDQIAAALKNFPIELGAARPLDEAISASGGLDLSELSDDLMIEKFPGLFAAGEMLDWDAPTGGFLIQACVAQGRAAGRSILARLSSG